MSSDGSYKYKSTKYSSYHPNSLENYHSSSKPTKNSFQLTSDGSYKSSEHSSYHQPHSQYHHVQSDHHYPGSTKYKSLTESQSIGTFYNQPINYGQFSGGGIASIAGNQVTESNYFLQDIGNEYKNIRDPDWLWSDAPEESFYEPETGDVVNINNSEYLPSSSVSDLDHQPPPSSSAILMQPDPANSLQTPSDGGSSTGITSSSSSSSWFDNSGDDGVIRGESWGESIYNPAPPSPAAGSIRNNNADYGDWTPSFTPSYFIGPVNQPSVDNTGILLHSEFV